MDASSDSEYVRTLASATSEHASTSSPRNESIGERMTSGEGCTSSEKQIEHTRCHWSQLAQFKCDIDTDDEEAVRADNVREFKELQRHRTWGRFFCTFGYDLGRHKSLGELVVGEKFATGGQAKLYQVQVQWHEANKRERDVRHGRKWVLKVFKKGTLLRQLKAQWPEGYLQFMADMWKRREHKIPLGLRYVSNVYRGTLLKDGRFAFLMEGETGDLRKFIEDRMPLRTGGSCGPLSKREAEVLMYRIAEGMEWLHNHNVIHRDLKAANVLIRYKRGGWAVYIADFECSIGVIGTGFFRAPEILQACKERNVSQRSELFTKEADVYSYGMTSYEILTGKLPFEGHSHGKYDLVLEGQRPEVPKYVDDWKHELLEWCWQSDPEARPTFGQILGLLELNSARAVEEGRRRRDKIAAQKISVSGNIVT